MGFVTGAVMAGLAVAGGIEQQQQQKRQNKYAEAVYENNAKAASDAARERTILMSEQAQRQRSKEIAAFANYGQGFGGSPMDLLDYSSSQYEQDMGAIITQGQRKSSYELSKIGMLPPPKSNLSIAGSGFMGFATGFNMGNTIQESMV